MTALIIVALLTVASSDIPGQTSTIQTDRYGGNLAIETAATGFFRVEKIGGRWLFVTPEGHGMLALGANHVGKFLDRQANELGLLDRFGGDRAAAAAFLSEQMREMQLTAGEAYHPHAPELQTRWPWIANVRFPFSSKFAFDVFDPAVRAKIAESLMMQCEPFREDPFVIGVALPDLPEWGERRLAYFRGLPPDSPGGRAWAAAQAEGLSDGAFLGRVAEVEYRHLREAMSAAAPNHLFLGERFNLRTPPEEVIAAVGPFIDVFCTQALILSPQRPPEWQRFQAERYEYESRLAGEGDLKPTVIIDWAAPFSLAETFRHDRGEIRNERQAAVDAADWLVEALEQPQIVGVFKCQLIGLHANDRWFDGRSRRTYLTDDGQPFAFRTAITRQAHIDALDRGYGMVERPAAAAGVQ